MGNVEEIKSCIWGYAQDSTCQYQYTVFKAKVAHNQAEKSEQFRI